MFLLRFFEVRFPNYGLAVGCNAFGLHGNDGLFAIVVQAYDGFSFIIEIHLGCPVKRAAVVLGIGQRLLAVIRAVEFRANGVSFCGIPSVPVGGPYPVVGQKSVVYDHLRLVGLAVFLASLFPWDVIGIDVQFIQIA